MSWFALSSLRTRLVLLVLLGAIPSLAVILYTGLEQRKLAADSAKEDALRVARLASATQERFMEGSRQLLVGLAQLSIFRGDDAQTCDAYLASLLKQLDFYINFGVIETNGEVFASALPVSGKVNLADRKYFQRAMETHDFSIGEYQIGRITGKSSINFGYPVLDDEGHVVRVVFSALELMWLNKMAQDANLPEQATMTVIDHNGYVLTRYPNPEQWIGKSGLEAPIVQIILGSARREGTAQARGLDGVQRLYAYTTLGRDEKGGDVFVTVGIPTAVAFGAAHHMLVRNLTLLGIVAILAVVAAWFGGDLFILRRVNALLNVTKRLREGELTARTGLQHGRGELDQLAQAFDQMAESLQQRGGERDRAAAQLKALNEDLERRVAERTQQLQARNEQMEDDLGLASEFQLAFLPRKYPSFPSGVGPENSALRFSHCYRPSGSVGGDYYEILPLSDTQAGVFLCDVMGHGVRAALVTAILRGLVEELSATATDPGKFMAELNRSLNEILRNTDMTMFATACYVLVDIERGTLRYASAGHPSPFLVRRNSGDVKPLVVGGNTPGAVLGLFSQSVYPTAETSVSPGDLIALYTDGVFEVAGPDGGEYGTERLLAAFQKRIRAEPQQMFEDILAEIEKYSASKKFDDDVCMVGVEVARVG